MTNMCVDVQMCAVCIAYVTNTLVWLYSSDVQMYVCILCRYTHMDIHVRARYSFVCIYTCINIIEQATQFTYKIYTIIIYLRITLYW